MEAAVWIDVLWESRVTCGYAIVVKRSFFYHLLICLAHNVEDAGVKDSPTYQPAIVTDVKHLNYTVRKTYTNS